MITNKKINKNINANIYFIITDSIVSVNESYNYKIFSKNWKFQNSTKKLKYAHN